MRHDRHLELIRTLTREVLEVARPETLDTFAEDFAAFASQGGLIRAEESAAVIPPRANPLDATLVAGMFFEVLMEAERLPASTSERVSFIRRRAKNYLVTRLAGHITLSQFFRLLNLIEANVEQYFRQEKRGWLGGPLPGGAEPRPVSLAQDQTPDTLRKILEELPLEPTGRRKLNVAALYEFLRHTGGEWFRLLDFETSLGVNKKTAWSYLNQLLQAGILKHNGERANRVRYCLADAYQKRN
jgi:hypothetical protein